jgi:hypothetical protein
MCVRRRWLMAFAEGYKRGGGWVGVDWAVLGSCLELLPLSHRSGWKSVKVIITSLRPRLAVHNRNRSSWVQIIICKSWIGFSWLCIWRSLKILIKYQCGCLARIINWKSPPGVFGAPQELAAWLKPCKHSEPRSPHPPTRGWSFGGMGWHNTGRRGWRVVIVMEMGGWREQSVALMTVHFGGDPIFPIWQGDISCCPFPSYASGYDMDGQTRWSSLAICCASPKYLLWSYMTIMDGQTRPNY